MVFSSIQSFQNCFFPGMTNRKCLVPRGKGIGGSSLINGFIYTKCNLRDYDRWAEEINDPQWSYSNLLPFFKKAEDFTRTNPYGPIDEEYHGYDGPLPVTQSIPAQRESAFIVRGGEELGYNFTDFNGENQMGVSIIQLNAKYGRRFDHAMAYLYPIKCRKNLKILDKSYLIKIEICELSKKVIGVIFTRKNKTFIARRRKEVILSAGAISSPQILMLSGIGPEKHLTQLGIPVIEDLPVGETLYDHVTTLFVFSSNISVYQSTEQSVRDFLKGRGPLTRAKAFDAFGWFKTPLELTENYPDLEVLFSNISGNVATQRMYSWTDETFSVLNADVPNPIAISFNFLNTKSVGTVKLKSACPYDYPIIDENMLGDPDNHDIESLYQGWLLLQNLIETEAFQKINLKLAYDSFPGCNHTVPMSREFWYCYFRRVSVIGLHPMGTCKTGLTPQTGVVNSNLTVFGVEGLRVADASVIRIVVRGHTNAPATVVGEKASDIIKKSYGF